MTHKMILHDDGNIAAEEVYNGMYEWEGIICEPINVAIDKRFTDDEGYDSAVCNCDVDMSQLQDYNEAALNAHVKKRREQLQTA